MKRTWFAVAVAASLTAVTALAQTTPPAQPGPGWGMGPMGGPGGPMGPMAGQRAGMPGRGGGWMQGQGFAQLDANKDGKISKDEVMALFDRLDTNKDGTLSPEELAAGRAQFAQHRQHLDANGDGMISRDEAKNAPRLASSFDALDTNKDGQLSREEMRGAWAGRGHQGPRVDANGDGLISRDEAKAVPWLSQNFDAIDANKDGSLSRDEIHAWRHAQSPTAAAPVKP